jgi:hypothetical protein
LHHFFEGQMPHMPAHIQSTCPSKKRDLFNQSTR